MVEPRRILAVKLADLGDVLLCEPALRSLRQGYPDARVNVLTTPHAAELLPLLDPALRVIPFAKELFDSPRQAARPDRAWLPVRLAARLRQGRYDLVVILHHLTTRFGALKFRALTQALDAPKVVGLDNGRGDFLNASATDLGFGTFHESEYMLAIALAAGGAVVDPAPTLHIPDEVALPVELPDRYVALFPATGAYSAARAWQPARFTALAEQFRDDGYGIVLVGADDAQPAARLIMETGPAAFDLTGRTSFAQLARVLASAALTVGGDSFIGHLAAAVGCPVLSIFGPSNVRAWQPYGTLDVVAGADLPAGVAPLPGLALHSGLPCAPCIYTGYRLGRPSGCPTRTCLSSIEVEQVAGAARRLLEERA
jgi:heptosyltransferase-2